MPSRRTLLASRVISIDAVPHPVVVPFWIALEQTSSVVPVLFGCVFGAALAVVGSGVVSLVSS